MSKILNLFRAIDQFLFEQVDRMKHHPNYQRLVDQIGSLSEQKQKLVNQISVISISSLPVLLLIIFFIGNCSVRSDYHVQRDILHTFNSISAKKTQLTSVGRQFFANYLITNKAELENKVKQAASSKQIGANKVKVDTFKKKKSAKDISEIHASLRFSDFSLTDLSGFLTAITRKEKMKVSSLSINKNKRKSLDGVIQVIHHGKSGK